MKLVICVLLIIVILIINIFKIKKRFNPTVKVIVLIIYDDEFIVNKNKIPSGISKIHSINYVVLNLWKKIKVILYNK